MADEINLDRVHYPENQRQDFNKIIKNDFLQRKDYVYNLARFLTFSPQRAVIALDGEWGSGKTVICHWLLKEYSNEPILKEKYSKVIYFNSWENDLYDSPLQSFLFELIQQMDLDNIKFDESLVRLKNVAQVVGNIALKKLTAGELDLGDVKKAFDKTTNDKKLTQKIHSVTSIKDRINELIENLITDEKKRILVIIDELDRCNPKYAVEFLENIKHFFNNENLVFLISCDKKELAHTIKGFYGNEFDGYKYLSRFFTIEMTLPSFNRQIYVRNLVSQYQSVDRAITSLGVFAEEFQLSIRDIQRVNTKFYMVKEYVNDSSDLFFLFLQYILILGIVNGDGLKKFLAGDDSEYQIFYDKILKIDNKLYTKDIAKEAIKIEYEQLVNAFKNNNDESQTGDSETAASVKMTAQQMQMKKFLEALTMMSYQNSY